MIKVYFIDLPNRKKNTASYNRFLQIVEMTSYSFETQVIKAKDVTGFQKDFKILRGFMTRFYMFLAALKVVKLDKQKKRVIYLFGIDPILTLFIYFITTTNNIKIIAERNEFPIEISKNRKSIIIFNKLFIYSWYFRLYDGFTVISNHLKEFILKYSKKNAVISILPMCVDFNRFSNVKNSNSYKPYLFYIGSLDNKKDGICYLVEAFIEISMEFTELKLIIAGSSSGQVEEKKIKNLINQHGLIDRLILLGNIDRDVVPNWLCNSKINILARPTSKQAEGGFPTKLGEYLASGKPTIVTRVGEIPLFLADDEVFFISPSDIKNELKEKIEFIFNNEAYARIVANRGMRVAQKAFSLKKNSLIIRKLINQIVKN